MIVHIKERKLKIYIVFPSWLRHSNSLVFSFFGLLFLFYVNIMYIFSNILCVANFFSCKLMNHKYIRTLLEHHGTYRCFVCSFLFVFCFAKFLLRSVSSHLLVHIFSITSSPLSNLLLPSTGDPQLLQFSLWWFSHPCQVLNFLMMQTTDSFKKKTLFSL